VCVPNGTDPEGNTCTWRHCGWDAAPPIDYYFGGCNANNTAGTLCCRDVILF